MLLKETICLSYVKPFVIRFVKHNKTSNAVIVITSRDIYYVRFRTCNKLYYFFFAHRYLNNEIQNNLTKIS